MLKANLFMLAAEGLYQACAMRFGVNMSTCKILGDCTMVIIAALSAYIMLGTIVGIREGTIISAICVGALVRWILPHLDFFELNFTNKRADSI